MDEKLTTKILQKLESLSDEQGRQLLDYMEYLESKHNRSSRDRSAFEKLADNVEGTIRASSLGGAAIKGTSQVLDAASDLMRGVVSAGRSVLDELQKLEEEAEAAARNESEGPAPAPDGQEEAGPSAAAAADAEASEEAAQAEDDTADEKK